MKNIATNKIFKLIKENKSTAKDFARKAKLAPNSITDWKTGRSNPSLEALRKISKAYNVQIEWLTGDSEYRTKEEEFKSIEEGIANARIN